MIGQGWSCDPCESEAGCWEADSVFLLDMNLRGIVTTGAAATLQSHGKWIQLQGGVFRERERKQMISGTIL